MYVYILRQMRISSYVQGISIMCSVSRYLVHIQYVPHKNKIKTLCFAPRVIAGILRVFSSQKQLVLLSFVLFIAIIVILSISVSMVRGVCVIGYEIFCLQSYIYIEAHSLNMWCDFFNIILLGTRKKHSSSASDKRYIPFIWGSASIDGVVVF